MTRRIAVVQSKNSLKLANKDRKHTLVSVETFSDRAGLLIDRFADYCEHLMKVPANGGRGCIMTEVDVDVAFSKMYSHMMKLMQEEEE